MAIKGESEFRYTFEKHDRQQQSANEFLLLPQLYRMALKHLSSCVSFIKEVFQHYAEK
jgi:hypothetical protein